MGMAQDVFKKFMSSLDNTKLSGRDALAEAVKASSSYSNWQNLIDSMVRDCQSYNDQNNYRGFLLDKCGINLDNEDTGAITGYDAGNGIVKTAVSVVPEDSDEFIYPETSGSTFMGLRVKWPTESELTDSQKKIIAGLNTWWFQKSLELVKESTGYSFEDSDASVKNITVKFSEGNKAYIAYLYYSIEDGKATELTLDINPKYYADIYEPNGISEENVKTYNYSVYFDRFFANTMEMALSAAKINNYLDLPRYAQGGLSVLMVGMDDDYKSVIEEVASNPSLLNESLQDDSSLDLSYQDEAGYILLRYFAKQANILQPKGATIEGDTIALDNSFYTSLWLDGTNIFSGEEVYKNDSIINIDAKNTSNNANLAGNNQNNRIEAGSGDSNIWGGWLGDDTMVGGSGRDSFWYAQNEGNDVIENISSNDVVNLFDVGFSDISGIDMADNNLKLYFNGGGSLNILNGASAGNIFALADGSSWRYDSNSGNWNMA